MRGRNIIWVCRIGMAKALSRTSAKRISGIPSPKQMAMRMRLIICARSIGTIIYPKPKSAQRKKKRRGDWEAIENRHGTPAIGGNIAIGATPARPNIAERVFENTWRSVVVVTNGDGQGSGVIIRPNIVATNCHVVDEGGTIAVYKSDNRRADTDTAFSATIRHSDTDKDFCLLNVDGLWGISATVRKYDTMKIGETVYALGAPKGLDLSISSGLVSQLRSIDGEQYIQTDAAISPGSSGGGLFDAEGNLVGIMTWKIAAENAEGIGFAIPADLVLTQ